MESLALLVALMFLTVLLAGPLALASTLVLPRWLGKFLCLLAFMVGIWWFLLPIGGARLFAMLTILLSARGLGLFGESPSRDEVPKPPEE